LFTIFDSVAVINIYEYKTLYFLKFWLCGNAIEVQGSPL